MKKLKKNLVTIILTFNSEKILNKNITSCKKLKGDILIIDSFSNDKTIKIAKKHNCKIIKRKFKNYSDQRNFAIKHANKFYEWQLHLDSDEILSKKSILLGLKKAGFKFDASIENKNLLVKSSSSKALQ